MTDGVIKGSGNSRYLKTVANALSLYPTWQDGLAAMIAGTFPIDLYGINPNGWQTQGTDLNKASLLKASTASQYGKGSTATVDDILAAIRPLITTAQSTADQKTQSATGSYTSTGQAMTITLPFAPSLFVVYGRQSDTYFAFALGIKSSKYWVAATASGSNSVGLTIREQMVWSGSKITIPQPINYSTNGYSMRYFAVA